MRLAVFEMSFPIRWLNLGQAVPVSLSATDTLLAHASLDLEVPEDVADSPWSVACSGGNGTAECVDQDLNPEPLLWAPGSTGMLTGS